MRKEKVSKGQSRKKPNRGILFGIPLLLFICGVALISIGSFRYIKSAFYVSSLFIQEDYKPTVQKSTNNSKREPKKNIAFPSYGDKFGDIVIDKASINVPVFHGDREEQLLKGVGHYSGSRFPGEGSNIVLAGHRNSVFKGLKNVAEGDLITLNTTYGEYEYKISEIKIVKGNDKSIVQPTDSEKLTLYTCYPFNYVGNAPNRYVVIADLVKGKSVKELMEEEGTN
jgi:sortase A